ncbi:hypothetical protein AALO_G00103580 [Alosa alosa]|uniref:Uncharacterized protein n=1 Tax=Alosa alosa TaxID=278164 RepID=A0AAV6GYK1_9TELE|nr:hypothetical protein AALO_G00103580 [Alosa alosa]
MLSCGSEGVQICLRDSPPSPPFITCFQRPTAATSASRRTGQIMEHKLQQEQERTHLFQKHNALQRTAWSKTTNGPSPSRGVVKGPPWFDSKFNGGAEESGRQVVFSTVGATEGYREHHRAGGWRFTRRNRMAEEDDRETPLDEGREWRDTPRGGRGCVGLQCQASSPNERASPKFLRSTMKWRPRPVWRLSWSGENCAEPSVWPPSCPDLQ